MIRVYTETDGGEYGLKMEGHAEYNSGNDVVCAGASAIAYALAGYLHNCGEHLGELLEERLDSGDLCLRCRGDALVGAAYRVAEIGLLQIQMRYPENVSVKIK